MRFIALIAAILLPCACNDASAPAQDGRSATSAMNDGVGLMGRFEFKEAEAAFAEAVERRPGSVDARINKAIAVLNQTGKGAQEDALAQLLGILTTSPGNVRAQYCAGICLLYLGRPVEAVMHLQPVASARPDDAYAAYFLGQALEQSDDPAAALASYEKAAGLDPFLRSSWLGIQRTTRRLGDEARSSEALARFEELARNPRSRLAEFRYTRMGPLAMANVGDSTPLPGTSAHAAGKAFLEGLPVTGAPMEKGGSSRATIQVVDLDGDGDSDIVLAGWKEDGSSLVLLRDGETFAPSSDHPLSGITRVRCMLFGDLDADGRVDAFVCRNGTNTLLLRTDVGGWTAAAVALGSDRDTVDGAMADLDHDGDLDFYCVNADGPNELLNNDGNGTFRDIAPRAGVDGGDVVSRQVMIADVDLDRDADIIVLNDGAPNEVWLNDRLWTYTTSGEFKAFVDADLLAVVPWYGTLDGLPSIRARTGEGTIETWVASRSGDWSPVNRAAIEDHDASDPAAIALADVTGDGRQDLLVARRGGFEIRDHANALLAVPTPMRGLESEHDVQGMSVLFDDAVHGPGVVVLSQSRGPFLYAPTEHRGGFAMASFSGRSDASQQMRSNASGIGVRWAARIGSHWQAGSTWRNGSGPGQGLQPVAIGLGSADAIDFVEIDWPDGVFQTELDVAAGASRITEAQRQISSCPLVFVRTNGEPDFTFVTDVLGVGGIGYLLEPGTASTPRPHEALLLESRPDELIIAEPMEEACYLDGVSLLAVDIPAGSELVLDERLAIGGPAATSVPFLVHDVVSPVDARNERDGDMLAAILEHDLVAADPGALDPRFIGMLAGEHVLAFSFDRAIDGHDVLLVDGWVEYPYSQTNFAAWQAGRTYDAPTLEALARDGRWVVVAEQFGYPAGMPRSMSLPLPPLPEGCRALRLRTNQEIYWDRIRLARRSDGRLEPIRCSISSATMARCGFPARTTGSQRQPFYDYARRDQFGDVRHQAGFYTEWGECTELLVDVDDACAIIGPGEEVRIRFAELPPPEPGLERRWILEFDGWCKDMDLFTLGGERLEPLPARDGGFPGAAALELMRRFNTRFASGR